jgi:hypothetical protein
MTFKPLAGLMATNTTSAKTTIATAAWRPMTTTAIANELREAV